MIDTTKTTTSILVFESKKLVGCLKNREMFFIKDVFLHWILLHTSENQTFQRAERFVMTHFIQNGLYERYSFISKVNKILKLNILKSLLAIGYWSRDKGGTG